MKSICIPQEVEAALRVGAALAVSISGGKDSAALAEALVAEHKKGRWPGPIFAVFADLGRADWQQTPEHVQRIAERLGLDLLTVRRPQGDLISRIEERLEALQGTQRPFWPSATNRYCTSHLKSNPIDAGLRKVQNGKQPFWPSSANRYCTSDLKRGPIDTALRTHCVVISAEGIRADESRERAKKPVVEVRKQITSTSKDTVKNLRAMTPAEALAARGDNQKVALNWRPLLHWTEEDVWEAIGTSKADLERRRKLYAFGERMGHEGPKHKALDGWPGHPAYVYGSTRLSCALCVLASENDLRTGAKHNPQVARHFIEMERATGCTFKATKSLESIVGDLV